MPAPDGSCRSCHFHEIGYRGTACLYTGVRVIVDDGDAGTCAAWRRYFDHFMYRDMRRSIGDPDPEQEGTLADARPEPVRVATIGARS